MMFCTTTAQSHNLLVRSPLISTLSNNPNSRVSKQTIWWWYIWQTCIKMCLIGWQERYPQGQTARQRAWPACRPSSGRWRSKMTWFSAHCEKQVFRARWCLRRHCGDGCREHGALDFGHLAECKGVGDSRRRLALTVFKLCIFLFKYSGIKE